jgi:hypothetical protein
LTCVASTWPRCVSSCRRWLWRRLTPKVSSMSPVAMLFVREVARAMAEGTWRPDQPPRTVLEVVSARLDRVSAGCRKLLQTAAIVGRD